MDLTNERAALCLCAIAHHHYSMVGGAAFAAGEHSASILAKLRVGTNSGLDSTMLSYQSLHGLLVTARRHVQSGDLGSLIERFVISSAGSELSVVRILGFFGQVARKGVIVGF